MKYGVREICDVVLRAKNTMKVGNKTFYKNEPVLYFDTLTTSSLEGAATTVYAQGGRGNARLLAWEGERTLTFNMTDALISPESFSVLSGADVIDASENNPIFVHSTSRAVVVQEGTGDNAKLYIYVPGRAVWNHKAGFAPDSTADVTDNALTKTAVKITKGYYNAGADIFLMKIENGGMSEPMVPFDGEEGNVGGVYHIKDQDGVIGTKVVNEIYTRIECYGNTTPDGTNYDSLKDGDIVLVDYYVKKYAGKQIEITPDKFGGYFYLEASTLWREEETGADLPAEFVIPRCKVQSNFTFTMAATGDPSTFDFVLDAFPDYSKFDQTKKILAYLQVIEETSSAVEEQRKHGKKRSVSAAENTEHKSRYAFGDNTYAASDDAIASSDS